MKIIFLDVDGVLNTPACWGNFPRFQALDDECCKRFLRLLDALFNHNVTVVLSSSWRYSNESTEALQNKLGMRFYSRTPTGMVGPRGNEIQAWLDARPQLAGSQILIIDDNSDMLDRQKPFLVQTNRETGLTEDDVAKCLRILLPNTETSV